MSLPAILSDAVVYASIAKEMAVSGDFVNLTYLGEDWLDKPHLPFWITAFSFRVFGVGEFALQQRQAACCLGLGEEALADIAGTCHLFGLEGATLGLRPFTVFPAQPARHVEAEASVLDGALGGCGCCQRFDAAGDVVERRRAAGGNGDLMQLEQQTHALAFRQSLGVSHAALGKGLRFGVGE